MGWKLLKKRRWDGPYSIEQLQQMYIEGKIVASDFLLDEFNDEKFPSNYKSVVDVLRANGVDVESLDESTIVRDSQEGKKQAKASIDENVVLSDFDKGEVTKLFDEQVEPTDLLPSKRSSSFSSAPPSESEEEEFEFVRDESAASASGRNLFSQLPWGRLLIVLVVLSVLSYVVSNSKKIFNTSTQTADKKPENKNARKPSSSKSASSEKKRRPRKSIRMPDAAPVRSPSSPNDEYEFEGAYEDEQEEENPRIRELRKKKKKEKNREKREPNDFDEDYDDRYEDDRDRDPDSDDEYLERPRDDDREIIGGDDRDRLYDDEENVDEYSGEEVEGNYDY